MTEVPFGTAIEAGKRGLLQGQDRQVPGTYACANVVCKGMNLDQRAIGRSLDRYYYLPRSCSLVPAGIAGYETDGFKGLRGAFCSPGSAWVAIRTSQHAHRRQKRQNCLQRESDG